MNTKMNEKKMNSALLARITVDPQLCHGKPCIRGLRYPVEMILELLSAGMTAEELLNDYEDLEDDDIRAVLLYAARLRAYPKTGQLRQTMKAQAK